MKYTLLYIIMVVGCLSLSACQQRPLYYHYEHVAAEGWEATDTLHFFTPAMKQGGEYPIQVGVSIESNYPFRNLSVIVAHRKRPAGPWSLDTLMCHFMDEKDRPLGAGTSLSQQLFPLTTLQVHEGDSLEFAIFHNMRRETLPGVNSVGIRITATN